MNKVLFVAPTKYKYPINEDLKSKFVILSEICKPFIFAFSDKKKTTTVGNTNLILNKKLNNRLLNYLKIIYLFAFIVPKKIKQYQIDIVCLQDPVTSYFAIKSLKFRNSKVKIILESHGDFIETIALEKKLLVPSIYKILFKLFSSYSVKNADQIRSISSFTEEQVKAYGYQGNFVRFPAWINLDKFLNAKVTRDSNNDFKIIFVGSVTDRKNPELIVKAISAIDGEISLEIIGPTPNKSYLNKLKESIHNSQHKENILLTPFTALDELIKKYSNANLFILASKSEGLGRVVIEAQATACPVLVSSNTGAVDLIIDNETGYIFENDNLNDLKDKIKNIIDNQLYSVQVGVNGKSFVTQNHTIENFKFGYKKLFDLVS
uniref:Glycosyltransferase n=1 Tax=Candidatus Actinomarina minuta TaxID=1389454 RepID=S5DJY0_9ACTN|nr:glycosyltransferase [Candidatus Actinomarina minuta]